MVCLVTSSRVPKDNEVSYHEGMGDIPGPDRMFEVAIGTINIGAKPNPLTLVVMPTSLDRFTLNNELYVDDEELATKLRDIFRQRENNAVWREGTNEVEKTVFIKIEKDLERERYGDYVRLIDTLKSAGASPIVFQASEDSLELDEVPEPPDGDIQTSQSKVPKVISGGVLNGKATFLPKPLYPPAARAVRASGPVTVQVTLETDGSVSSASAVSGHPLLRSAAVQAAKQSRFSPTLLSGTPVKVTGVLVFTFVLPPDLPQ
jgi:TonB family protein